MRARYLTARERKVVEDELALRYHAVSQRAFYLTVLAMANAGVPKTKIYKTMDELIIAGAKFRDYIKDGVADEQLLDGMTRLGFKPEQLYLREEASA